jgi:hypothetical protein
MKYYLLVVSVALMNFASAQYVETEEKERPKKNGIGFGINPIVAVMLGAGNQGLHYGIQYRRLLNDNSRLRTGLFYQSAKFSLDNGAPVGITDSTLIKLNGSNGYRTGEFRMGIEFSDFTAKHDAFYGVDAIVGYNHSYYHEVREEVLTQRLEDSQNIYGEVVSTDTVKYYSDYSMVLGIAPTVGFRVQMKEHMELLASASFEIVYNGAIKTDTYGVNQIHSNSSFLEFRTRILDLVLSYRF